MTKLSIYMITKNEEKRLAKTLESIRDLADEIIVVDSLSTDNTEKIARSFNVQFFTRPFTNYCEQKSYAESLCSNEWLLNIDADEVLTPHLVSEIKEILKQPSSHAYKVKIYEMYPGYEKPIKWASHYNIIRLYNKLSFKMPLDYTHDRVVPVDARPHVVGQLRNHINHYSFQSIFDIVNKYNKYTNEQVDSSIIQGKSYSPFRMILAIPLNFMKYYFLKRYFLYGYWGFIHSTNIAYMRFLKFSKFYESKQRESLNKANEQRGS